MFYLWGSTCQRLIQWKIHMSRNTEIFDVGAIRKHQTSESMSDQERIKRCFPKNGSRKTCQTSFSSWEQTIAQSSQARNESVNQKVSMSVASHYFLTFRLAVTFMLPVSMNQRSFPVCRAGNQGSTVRPLRFIVVLSWLACWLESRA